MATKRAREVPAYLTLKRTVFTVRPRGGVVTVDVGRTVVWVCESKREAEGYAKARARELSTPTRGAVPPVKTQVVVFDRYGRFQGEWTYPRESDPRHRRG